MKKKIFLNGRFLTKPLTGVQRTAFEMVEALDDLLEQNIIAREDQSFILIYSGTIVNPIRLKHISLLKKGVMEGNLWEQLELPLYTVGSLLISMCTISTLFKRKQMVIIHDASFLVNPQFFSTGFRSWYKLAIPALGKIARHIITVSTFSKKELIRHAGIKEEKISVVYNAADHLLRFGEPNIEFKRKIDALKPYCLAVSSLGSNKNFKGLSDAVKKADLSTYNMLIAGGAISVLKETAAHDNAVTYLGYVSNEELKYLYSQAALFIFPSFYEGFGIPPLEAMISGCPVLASNTSAMPEVLESACVYFDPYLPGDLAIKMQQLLRDSNKLEELKEKGFLQAAKYSWKSSALNFYKIMNTYGG